MFDVVMPLFDKEQFVRASIRSVLDQSFEDWRASRSSTTARLMAERMRVARFQDPRIILIRQANRWRWSSSEMPASRPGRPIGLPFWTQTTSGCPIISPSCICFYAPTRTPF